MQNFAKHFNLKDETKGKLLSVCLCFLHVVSVLFLPHLSVLFSPLIVCHALLYAIAMCVGRQRHLLQVPPPRHSLQIPTPAPRDKTKLARTNSLDA